MSMWADGPGAMMMRSKCALPRLPRQRRRQQATGKGLGNDTSRGT